MKFIYSYSTFLGNLFLVEENKNIVYIHTQKPMMDGCIYLETDLIQLAFYQLNDYFQGKRKTFDFPIHMNGTPFQVKVWKALQNIPYGETRSYQEIANIIGCHHGSRAVGSANHRNKLLIVVPCHRIVGSDGSLTGFALGISLKQQLLDLEKTNHCFIK